MAKYTKTHEWVTVEGELAIVGITKYAVNQLGEVVFVELPEEGQEVEKGESICNVESTKSASEIFAPVSGIVRSVNEELEDSPELVSEDPENKGWLFKIEMNKQEEVEDLLEEKAYNEITGD
jgi:glycine cleavage system H protein